jgi:hypothetical protein
MNQSHFPRLLISLLFILVALTFMAGILRAFSPVHAVSTANISPMVTLYINTPSASPVESESETPFLLPTAMATNQPDSDAGSSSTPIPEEDFLTDMTGIVSLGILMVVVILVGVAWGGRDSRKKKTRKSNS